MRDKSEQTIEVGDFFVIARATDWGPILRYGRVTEISQNLLYCEIIEDRHDRVTSAIVTNSDRLLVVAEGQLDEYTAEVFARA